MLFCNNHNRGAGQSEEASGSAAACVGAYQASSKDSKRCRGRSTLPGLVAGNSATDTPRVDRIRACLFESE